MIHFKYLSIFLKFSQGNRKSFGLIILMACFFFILEGCGGLGSGVEDGTVSSGELEIIIYNNVSSGTLLKDNDDLSNLIKPIEATGSEKDVIFYNFIFKDHIRGYKTKLDLVALGNGVDVKNYLLGAQDIIENKVLKGKKALTLFSEGKVADSTSKQTYCQEISEKLMGDSSFFVLDANTGSCKLKKHPRVFVTTAELKKAVQVFLSKKPNTKVTIAYKPCCDGLMDSAKTISLRLPPAPPPTVNIPDDYYFDNLRFDESQNKIVWNLYRKEKDNVAGMDKITEVTSLPSVPFYELNIIENNGKHIFNVQNRRSFPAISKEDDILFDLARRLVSFDFSLVLTKNGEVIRTQNLGFALNYNCKTNSSCKLEIPVTIE